MRFAANRNISRPNFGDLSAAAQVRVAGFGGTISAGNPYLAPFRADSIETSIKYYAGTRSYLAAGVFYKDMASFVTSETAQLPNGKPAICSTCWKTDWTARPCSTSPVRLTARVQASTA